MYGVLLKLKLNYFSKMHGYPQFFFFKQKTAYEITTRLVGSEMCIRDREKVDLSKYSWYPKRKLGVTMHF